VRVDRGVEESLRFAEEFINLAFREFKEA